MPKYIEEYLFNICKREKVTVRVMDGDKLKGNMEFDATGFSKTITEQFSIVGYINRLVKYGKKSLQITVNGVLLDKLPVFLANDAVRQVAGQGS